MFAIKQWRGPDGQYVIQILFDGEPLATYALNRQATEEELKKMLDIVYEMVGKAIDDAVLYGEARTRKTGGKHA